jgi:hypothetical protein
MLTVPELKLLSANIYHHFRKIDAPHEADDIFVPIDSIKYNKDENRMYASVRFAVDWCGRKQHSIRIKFSLDDKKRFMPESWSYA